MSFTEITVGFTRNLMHGFEGQAPAATLSRQPYPQSEGGAHFRA
jgi:hypothetical protein